MNLALEPQPAQLCHPARFECFCSSQNITILENRRCCWRGGGRRICAVRVVARFCTWVFTRFGAGVCLTVRCALALAAPPMEALPHKVAVVDRRDSCQAWEVRGAYYSRSHVENPMEPSGGSPDLDDGEGGRSCDRVSGPEVGGWKAAADEDAHGADQVVADDPDGVDFDADGGSVRSEKMWTDSEDELVVPRRVCSAKSINLGTKLVGRVYPDDRIGLHAS